MGYKGILLDCSRNAVMHLDGIKRFVNTISLMGYNALMLYTEDTYEVDGEPLFGYLRGRYTKEEIKEIDEYCFCKGVTLIPCIQTLAHLPQLFRWNPYQEIRDVDDVLLVGSNRTYELIENMFKTLRSCVRSKYINIGMDEAYMLGLGKYKDKNGFRPRSEIFLEHLNRVCGLAKKYDFEPMVWSDMFFSNAKEKEYGDDLLKKLPDNLTLIDWNYDIQSVETHEERFEKHKKLNPSFWFASGAFKWAGFSASIPDIQIALRNCLTACKNKEIDNTILTLWGDDGNETPAYAVLANIFFQSEYLKGNTDEDAIAKKFEETFGEKWSDFYLFHLVFKDSSLKRSESSQGAKSMLYNDPFLGAFDSMVVGDGKEAREWANMAKELRAAAGRSRSYSYIFESYACLCEVLEIKHELGVRTRQVYSQNREKLADLILDYKEVEIRLERFIEAFRTMWYKDNKPHGFDVQELRLGGLVMRLRSCRVRLQALMDGTIDKIPELQEKIVDYYTGSDVHTKGVSGYNQYIQNATVNRL